MLLTTLERLLLLNTVLPAEGLDFTKLRIVHDLRMDTSFDEKESKTLNFRTEITPTGSAIKWNPIPDKDVSIGDIAKEIIVDGLVRLDKTNKLQNDHWTLCEKFNLSEKLKELEDEKKEKEIKKDKK